MNWKSVLMVAMVSGAVSVAAEKVKLDNEHAKGDAWAVNKSWKIEKDSLTGSSKGSATLSPKKKTTFKNIEFQVDVTPVKVMGKSWKVAGILLQAAPDQYWQLALIERPDIGKAPKVHFFELKEKQGKVWGAESKLKRLKFKQATWEYGKTYKLTIKVKKDLIDGIVADDKGKAISYFSFALKKDSVSAGTPALRVSLMEAKFANIKVAGEK